MKIGKISSFKIFCPQNQLLDFILSWVNAALILKPYFFKVAYKGPWSHSDYILL